MRILLPAFAAIAFAAAAGAQDTEGAEPPAGPCTDEVYRHFDFWLGTWDVTGPNGQAAGVNRITAEESGCLIVEHWTNTNGGTGQSYNFYDPGIEQWRQVWVSGGLIVDYTGGLTEDGVMRLDGRATYHGGGTADFFGEWRPQDDGSVIQHFEQRNAETGEFEPWFTGTYRRRSETEEAGSEDG